MGAFAVNCPLTFWLEEFMSISRFALLGVGLMSLATSRAFAQNTPVLFPVDGASNISPDTPLSITFSQVPKVGAHGTIEIRDVASNTVVESIDVSSPTSTKTIGGFVGFKYYPILINDKQAGIYPKNGELGYGKKYSVKVSADAFENFGGAEWTFTTKPAAPAAGAARVVVAADGSGDFCTIQGALDFLPEANKAPVTIFIRKGVYREIIAFTERDNVTLLGEDRKQTIIEYANNANFNASGGNPYATTGANPSDAIRTRGGSIYRRGMFLAHRVNDLTIANLTMHNTTAHGGSQSEAIILNGTTSARAIVKDVDLYSFQDTLQINGQAYVSNCYIEGDVDFMWGNGPTFFENCICRSVRSNAFYTQIRNPASNHGFVYYHCTFDGSDGVTGNVLSRIEPGRFPASEVVLIDCVTTDAVGGVAWKLDRGTDPAQVKFWEFNSHTKDGSPADSSKRAAFARQLKQPADAELISQYSDPTFVLGKEWKPRSAPIFAAGANGRP